MTDSAVVQPSAERQEGGKCLVFLLPVAIFIALAIALAWGLTRDPRQLPSALIAKPVPEFAVDRAGIEVVDAFFAEIGANNLARYIDESGKVAQQLNALGLPTTLLLDREGREIARHVGPAEWDTPSMVAFFRQQLGRETGSLPP